MHKSQDGFCPKEFTDQRKEKLNKICDSEMKVLGTLCSGPFLVGAIKKGFHKEMTTSSDVNNEDKGQMRACQTEEAADAEAPGLEGIQGI